MTKLTIKEGKRRVSFFQQLTKFFRIYVNKKSVEYNVKFDKSCLYDSSKLEGINKLFGLTFGLKNVHKTSARFGWQPTKQNTIELSAYIYNDSIRYEFVLAHINPGDICKLKLEVTESEYIFSVNGTPSFFKHEPISSLSYLNFIYFGGLNTAPHDMIIEIEKD